MRIPSPCRLPVVFTDGDGLPIGAIVAGLNRPGPPLLRPILERLSGFEFFLSETVPVDLDSNDDSRVTHDLLEEVSCGRKIERTNSRLRTPPGATGLGCSSPAISQTN